MGVSERRAVGASPLRSRPRLRGEVGTALAIRVRRCRSRRQSHPCEFSPSPRKTGRGSRPSHASISSAQSKFGAECVSAPDEA